MLGGVAVFDYNNDGCWTFSSPTARPFPRLRRLDPSYWNRLYRNNGDGTFTDVTEQAGVKGVGYSMGVAAGDYDNDGFVDLYVAGVNRNQLLHNNGDGTFTDVTEKAGVAGTVPATASHGRLRRDGSTTTTTAMLDLMVINYLRLQHRQRQALLHRRRAHLLRAGELQGHAEYPLPQQRRRHIYRRFGSLAHRADTWARAWAWRSPTTTTTASPMSSSPTTRCPIFCCTTTATAPSQDVALEQGVAYTSNGALVAGMGAEFRDLNNDGLPDIFHTAMFGNTFPLYRNTGAQFDDVTETRGCTAFSHRMTAWSTGAFDFDNDGLEGPVCRPAARFWTTSWKCCTGPRCMPERPAAQQRQLHVQRCERNGWCCVS